MPLIIYPPNQRWEQVSCNRDSHLHLRPETRLSGAQISLRDD